ncbi:MAG: D-sedoheptulose 7-phosphate isomerase [Candidatus Margulisbacteria bacterium]|nr:D-sedoheptulose 7-phosphate isomerase [Candidatus Margulisiibacteriota bacterium]
MFNKNLSEHSQTFNALQNLEPQILELSEKIVKAFKTGNKVFFFGNGGSAADAQHFAAELTGRFQKERRALPAIALTTDTSALTALGNDYGFDIIFSRQVEALASEGDVLIGISTSGNSANVVKALETGAKLGCYCCGLSGNSGGKMNNCCELNIVMPSKNTPRIQEAHIFIIHTLCQLIEDEFAQ